MPCAKLHVIKWSVGLGFFTTFIWQMGVQKVKTYKMINVSVQVHIVAGLCWFENKQDLEAERGHLCKI